MNLNVIIPDIIGNAVSKMVLPTGIVSINYQFGTNLNVINSLDNKDGSPTNKGSKYPMIALLFPIIERRGSFGYYASVLIKRVIISTLSDDEPLVQDRYLDTGNFKKILYPLYYEFLNQLAASPNLLCTDPDSIVHTKVDRPNVKASDSGSNDVVDSIEILNMELLINQLQNC